MQRAKNTEKNIEGKKGGLTLVNKKIYYKATVIKGVSFFCKDSQIHQIQQRNRSENWKTDWKLPKLNRKKKKKKT